MNNKEVLNEAFFGKKKSYSEKLQSKLPHYEPVNTTKPGFNLSSDAEELKKRLTGTLGAALGNNTVKSLASRSIKKFPIIVSEAVNPNTVVMFKRLLEDQVAEYIRLLVDNQVIDLSSFNSSSPDGGNIAIQALDQLSGVDMGREDLANKAYQNRLKASDVFSSAPLLYSLIRHESEIRTGNQIIDTLLENAVVMRSEDADEYIGALNEAMIQSLNEVAITDRNNNRIDYDKIVENISDETYAVIEDFYDNRLDITGKQTLHGLLLQILTRSEKNALHCVKDIVYLMSTLGAMADYFNRVQHEVKFENLSNIILNISDSELRDMHFSMAKRGYVYEVTVTTKNKTRDNKTRALEDLIYVILQHMDDSNKFNFTKLNNIRFIVDTLIQHKYINDYSKFITVLLASASPTSNDVDMIELKMGRVKIPKIDYKIDSKVPRAGGSDPAPGNDNDIDKLRNELRKIANDNDGSLLSILANRNDITDSIKDRISKAIILLETNRIAGYEFIDYCVIRLGLPISAEMRKEILLKYPNIMYYGHYDEPTSSAEAYLETLPFTKKELKSINKNNVGKTIKNTLASISLKKIANVTDNSGNLLYGFDDNGDTTVGIVGSKKSNIRAIGGGVVGAIGGGVVGAGAATAIGTIVGTIAAMTPIGIAVGAAAAAAVGAISAKKHLISAWKKTYEKNLIKYKERINSMKNEGWERVEALIIAMDRQRENVHSLIDYEAKRAEAQHRLNNSGLETEDEIKSKYGDNKPAFNTVDRYKETLFGANTNESAITEARGAKKYEFNTNVDDFATQDEIQAKVDEYVKLIDEIAKTTKGKIIKTNESFSLYTPKQLMLEREKFANEFIAEINEICEADPESLTEAVLDADSVFNFRNRKGLSVGVKSIKYDPETEILMPSYAKSGGYAYGSVEIDKKANNDRRYNTPLILKISFKDKYSNDSSVDNELTAVIGILGEVYRVPSDEMKYILKSNAEGDTLINVIKGDKDTSSFAELLAGTKLKTQAEKLAKSNEIWHNLEKVAKIAMNNKYLGKSEGAMSNCHIIFAQKEIDDIRSEEGIDYIRDTKLPASLMKRYSAFSIIVANDAGDRASIFDDMDGISWDIVPYSALQKSDNSDQLISALASLNRGRM